MEFLKRLDPLWLALLLVGGLNWACIALFDTNVVSEIFGSGTVLDVVYVLVGVAALAYALPRLAGELGHVGHHRARPHGA
ncbi:MAG TPA: DUF378 domain-containing protein [Baekduia sp.]|nr:DUF378 domain-containing protein [Baekduia sp.]